MLGICCSHLCVPSIDLEIIPQENNCHEGFTNVSRGFCAAEDHYVNRIPYNCHSLRFEVRKFGCRTLIANRLCPVPENLFNHNEEICGPFKIESVLHFWCVLLEVIQAAKGSPTYGIHVLGFIKLPLETCEIIKMPHFSSIDNRVPLFPCQSWL